MSKIYLICGKICSGKSYYAARLAREKNAVILSCDELSKLFGESGLGEDHDAIMVKVKQYLLQKARDILACGTDVILEWGFWIKEERTVMEQKLQEWQIAHEWHYLDISEECLKKHIEKRNANPGPSDYFVDEGLLQKCLGLFEAPERSEIDVWMQVEQ